MRARSFVLLFLMLCSLSLLIGARQISWAQLWSFSGDAWLTLSASRLPRLAALVLSGIGLSVCGVILQHIVRNKFVEPATSGGLDAAKLGILIALTLAPTSGTLGKLLFALLFCFASSLIFIAVVRRIRFKNTVLVPVIGLMYGGVLSAIAEFYAYQHQILQSMQGWMLGDFSKILQGNYEIIYLILPIVLLTYLYAHRFTVLGMGEGMVTMPGPELFRHRGPGFDTGRGYRLGHGHHRGSHPLYWSGHPQSGGAALWRQPGPYLAHCGAGWCQPAAGLRHPGPPHHLPF